MESWNILANHFANFTNDRGNSSNIQDDISRQLGIQNMEIKLEPIDPDDSTEPLELVETMHNIANSANGGTLYFPKGRTSDSVGYRYLNERNIDNTIFDFGLESTSGNSDLGNKVINSSNELTSLSAEDQYYLSLVKFEDSIVYICPACGEEFKAQEVWKRHLNIVHNYNTRQGLNFIQLDKLYHKCLECNKRIAMHSMENLLKHKFTHLPYRCSKCNVCRRQYKYRQDLMVHIRLIHRDELLADIKNGLQGRNKRRHANLKGATQQSKKKNAGLAIGDVKENAYDIFENSCVNVEIKNEFIDPNYPDDSVIPPKRRLTTEDMATIPLSNSYIEDGASLSGSVSQNGFNDVDESLEEYILFNCPQCGTECESLAQWCQHIDFVHDFKTRKGLNFKDVEMTQQSQCLECNQVVTPNTIKNLQNHKFSHLPDSEWLKCKLCFSSFNIHKHIIEHLAAKHRLHASNIRQTTSAVINGFENIDEDSQDNCDFSGFDDYDNGAGAADTKCLLAGHDIYTANIEEHDKFEKYIEYICPKCGREYTDKKRWRKHFVNAHQLADFDKLNFEIIKDRQLKCRECKKIITNAYDIQNAQQHSITHMKYNAFARCRLCLKTYTDRKTLYKHLRSSHSKDISGITKRLESSKSNRDANYSNSTSSGGKTIIVSKQKEIVHFADCIYEIYYLDEDEDNSSNVGIIAKDDEDFDECSEYIFNKSLQQAHCHKCKDCGAMFSTHPALLFHIKNEHGSVNTNNSSISSRQTYDIANDDFSNDCDDLLIPTGDVDMQLEETASFECNFIYLCPECGEEFRIQSMWRRHINVEHNFDKRDFLDFHCIDRFHYQCKVCKDIVQGSKLKGLQDHKFRHCPYKLYLKCLLCGTCYNHKPNMLTHLRQRHNITDYQETSSTASNLTMNNYENTNSRHIKSINDQSNGSSSNSGSRPGGLKTVEDVISFHNAVDHDSITYHCPSCYENFSSHVFWRKHIVEVHKLNSREGLNFRKLDAQHYICLQCYKRVTVTHTKGAIGQLQSHKFRHLPYKSFRCTVCQCQFVRKQMFFKHLDRNTNKCNGYNDDFYSGNNDDRSYSDQYDDDFDLSGALVQRNGGDADGMDPSIWSSRYSLQSASNDSTTDKQDCFTINCPLCGAHFEGTRSWHEHINSEHKLNNCSALNLKKISPRVHQCLQCHEYIHESKLYDLQVHRFRHLPYGAYIHCRYCRMSCYHFNRMQEHLKRKHPHMMHKTSEDTEYYNNIDEDSAATIEDEMPEHIDNDIDGNGDEYPDCDNDGDIDIIDNDDYAQEDNDVNADADIDDNTIVDADADTDADVDADPDTDVVTTTNVDVDAVTEIDDDDAEADADVDVDADADTEIGTDIHADADADADAEENDGSDVEANSSSDDVDLVEVEGEIEEVDPDAAESEEQYLLG